jgi:hypothetical protein
MSWLDDVSPAANSPFSAGAAESSTAVLQGSSTVSLEIPYQGASAVIFVNPNSLFNFGAGQFTVEGWWYLASALGAGYGISSLIGNFSGFSGNTDASYQLYYDSTANAIKFSWTTDGHDATVATLTGGSISLDAWHHIAATRDGSGNISLYVDGTRVATTNIGTTQALHSTTGTYSYMCIGNDASQADSMGGYADGVRLTNGAARYTGSSYSPPDSPYPTGGSDPYWSDTVLSMPFGPASATTNVAITGVSETGAVNSLGVQLSGAGFVALTGVASTGQLGNFVNGGASLTLPTPQLAITGSSGAAGSVALTQPTPTLSITGQTAVSGSVAVSLPPPTLSIAAVVGASGSVVLALPAPVLAVGQNGAIVTQLPTPQLAISAVTGAVGSVSVQLPSQVLSLGAQVPYVGNAALALPTPTLQIQGTTGIMGMAATTLNGLALAIQGATGVVGSVTVSLPVFQLDVDGYMPVIGVVELTLPALQLTSTGQIAAAGGAATVVMHTETNAVSEYTNFPFNSFAQFNGVYLGASDAAGNSGIFALTGDTDNGTLIQAAARVGITDFATSHLKRVDRCYVGYRTDGNLVMRVLTDEINQRDYLLTGTGAAGLHGNHVRFGKGLTARYWQFEVRNQGGAYFDMNMIELKPTVLKRRIGGGDA